MDLATRRSTAETPVEPAVEAPAPGAAFGSNQARAAALGLASGPGASVDAATVDAAANADTDALSATLAALPELIRTLGPNAAVVLHALPLAEVAPVLGPFLGLPWVGEWLRSLEPGELFALPEPVLGPLLAAAIPEGTTARLAVEVRLALAFGVLLGGEFTVAREGGGLRVAYAGRGFGTFGLGYSANASGADDSLGLGASATAEAGTTLALEWQLRGALPPQLGKLLLADVAAPAGALPALAAVLERLPPSHVEAGLGGGAEANAGVDAPNLEWAAGHLGADLLGRAEAVLGQDQGVPYTRLGWRADAAGRAGEGAASGSARITLEAWGAAPNVPSITRTRLTTVAQVGGETLRDEVEPPTLADAAARVEAALSGEAPAPVGVLRVEREHVIEAPAAVADLVGPGLDGGDDLDLFLAKTEGKRTARVAVVVDDRLPAAPGMDAADAETRRDQQRVVAATVLGEVYEAPGLDPVAGSLDHAALAEVSVEMTVRGAAGVGAGVSALFELSGGVKAGITLSRRVDLTGDVPLEDAARLLTA